MTTYREAGVDIEAANKLTSFIKTEAGKTSQEHVLNDIGGFASLYELPPGYKDPVLVSATDGVGTKLKMALERPTVDLSHIGIDLVANVVNDIICTGGDPLYFLDYYASGKLHSRDAENVIEGIVNGCMTADISLIGGETSEMPGMYMDHDFDLAGFCVGIVDRDNIINGVRDVAEGDIIIGIQSSGPHSNGYSLIRRLLRHSINYTNAIIDDIMSPTIIYSHVIHDILDQVNVNGIANITGGGLYDNLPRIINDELCCSINSNNWILPDVFKWIQERGNVTTGEMYKVFNMGIGMVVIVDPAFSAKTHNIIKTHSLQTYNIGTVIPRSNDKVIINNI